MIISLILFLATSGGATGSSDPFAVGNCGVTRVTASLGRPDGTKGQRLAGGSFVKIVDRKQDQVEVTWIPSLFHGCEYKNGTFAGWVRRRDMSREYTARGSNTHDSVQPVEPAPIFDRPGGKEVGHTHRNDNLWVISRKPDGWILVTTEFGVFAPRAEDWVQPRGWVTMGSLEPFALADPLGPAGGDESPVFRRLTGDDAPDGGEHIEVLGKHFSSKSLCNSETFDPRTFLTSTSKAPYAFYCGPDLDSDPGPPLVTVLWADGTPHSKKIRRDARDEAIVAILRKLVAQAEDAAQPGVAPDGRSPSAPARR